MRAEHVAAKVLAEQAADEADAAHPGRGKTGGKTGAKALRAEATRQLHYNQVLREQLAALQHSASPCIAQPGAAPWGRQPMPATVDAAWTLDMQALDDQAREIVRDITLLRDPASRRALIDQIEVASPDDEPDAFAAMLLMQAMAGALNGPKRRRGRA